MNCPKCGEDWSDVAVVRNAKREALAAPPSDPAEDVCGACGHNDPHVKNGGCGADLMREGPPPYFDQCMCDGKSGSRIVRFWSDRPSDPLAPARGCLLGIAASAVLWTLIIAIAWRLS